MMAYLAHLTAAMDRTMLIYFVLLNSFYALLLLLSFPELWTHFQLADEEYFARVLAIDALPPISVLVPAYNEEVTIAASVLSFLTLEYPRHEVVLVNDGSKDRTMEELVRAYDLYEVPPAIARTLPTANIRAVYRSRTYAKLLVIDKENGGKADSLNAAINAARFPYVIACDADTLIEPGALLRLARPFLLGREIAAVGGTIRVVNACKVEHGRVVQAKVDSRWLGIPRIELAAQIVLHRVVREHEAAFAREQAQQQHLVVLGRLHAHLGARGAVGDEGAQDRRDFKGAREMLVLHVAHPPHQRLKEPFELICHTWTACLLGANARQPTRGKDAFGLKEAPSGKASGSPARPPRARYAASHSSNCDSTSPPLEVWSAAARVAR